MAGWGGQGAVTIACLLLAMAAAAPLTTSSAQVPVLPGVPSHPSGDSLHAPAAYFEANEGQHAPHVRYALRGGGIPTIITDQGAGFLVGTKQDAWAVFLEFQDAPTAPAAPAAPAAQEILPGRSHFLRGAEPEGWHLDVAHAAKVIHEDVWPGIDVVWHATSAGPKFDVVVAPGADPSLARFFVAGATDVRIDDARLVMDTPAGDLVKDPPVAYQPGGAPVDVAYRRTATGFTFDVGPHDRSSALVIDPLVYGTFLGGDNVNGRTDHHDNAVDGSGNLYFAGASTDISYPTTPGAHQPVMNGQVDAIVGKLDPLGSGLVYATYLGGSIPASTLVSPWESIRGIAVDDVGNAWLAGVTGTQDYPVTSGAFQTVRGGGTGEAFVTKLDPSGAMVYSTFLGGSASDDAEGIAIDGTGAAYVIGSTTSADFPVTSGAYQTTMAGGGDVFVTKLDAAGANALYSTFLGDDGPDFGTAIDVDPAGRAHLLGRTYSPGFPITPGAPQPVMAGDEDLFVARLGAAGATLLAATFLGGTGQDDGAGIGVDHAGRSHIAGTTASADFPVTAGAHATSFAGGYGDGFLTVWAESGLTFEYSTYFGGSRTDTVWDLAMNRTGIAYMTGQTSSADHPTTPGAIQPALAGRDDVFVTVMAPPWPGLVESTYLGGTADDGGLAISIDTFCSAYVVGRTMSDGFPVTAGAYKTARSDGEYPGDGFAAKMFGCAPGPTADFDIEPDPVCYNQPVDLRFLGMPGLVRFPFAYAWWDLGDGTTVLQALPDDLRHVYGAPGTYAVRLNATDVLHREARAAHDVEAVNCPPRILPLANHTIQQDERVSFTVAAEDPNGDVPRLSARMLPYGASFDPATGRFDWIPKDGQRGLYRIDFTATDEYGLDVTRSVFIHVLFEADAAPGAGPDVAAMAPRSSDADGDGMPDGTEDCPAEAAVTGACGVVEGELLELACKDATPRPDEASAHWEGGTVRVSWTHDTPCPIDAYLVWNGTSDLIAVVPPSASFAINDAPAAIPHRYHVQGVLAGDDHRFDRERARATNLVQPPSEDAAGPAIVPPEEPRPVGALGEMIGVKMGPGLWAVTWGGLAFAGLLIGAWYAADRAGWLRLFSRIKEHEVLRHPLRIEIAALVAAEPGIHFTDLCERIGKGSGATRHHLRVLVEAKTLIERPSGNYKCYYPPDLLDRGVQELGGLVRSEVARRLLRAVAEEPGQAVAPLASRLGVDPATVRYHLRRFEAAGLTRINGPRGAFRAYPGARASEALEAFAP